MSTRRLLLPWLAALAGCAAQAPVREPPAAARPAPATPPAAPHDAPEPSPLDAESAWLAALFDGTPLSVQRDADGGIRLELPLRHAFEGSRAQPTPGLEAVLQRVALVMRRQPAVKLLVALPAPGAAERAAALRARLQALGVAGYRSGTSAAAVAGALRLRLAPPPPQIVRLDDRTLPRCAEWPQAASSPPNSGSCRDRGR